MATFLRVSVAHSPDLLTSTKRSIHALPRPAKLSDNFAKQSGKGEASNWPQIFKLKVYKAVALPTSLYSCEIWTVYELHGKELKRFHLNCLRTLLKIT